MDFLFFFHLYSAIVVIVDDRHLLMYLFECIYVWFQASQRDNETNENIPQKYRFDAIVPCGGIQAAAGHFVMIVSLCGWVCMCECLYVFERFQLLSATTELVSCSRMCQPNAAQCSLTWKNY